MSSAAAVPGELDVEGSAIAGVVPESLEVGRHADGLIEDLLRVSVAIADGLVDATELEDGVGVERRALVPQRAGRDLGGTIEIGRGQRPGLGVAADQAGGDAVEIVHLLGAAESVDVPCVVLDGVVIAGWRHRAARVTGHIVVYAHDRGRHRQHSEPPFDGVLRALVDPGGGLGLVRESGGHSERGQQGHRHERKCGFRVFFHNITIPAV